MRNVLFKINNTFAAGTFVKAGKINFYFNASCNFVTTQLPNKQ